MSIRIYCRPRNGLPETTGSISVALKSREQGTLSLPCARSAEYFLCPDTVNSIVPPRHKNSKHTRRYLSRQMSYNSSSFTATVYRSEAFSGSLSHTNDSPTANIRGSLKYVYSNFFRKTLPWQLLSQYVSSPCSSLPLLMCTCHTKANYVITMLCCKIFVGHRPYKKFFNTKIFATKNSYNEKFPNLRYHLRHILNIARQQLISSLFPGVLERD